MRWTSPKWVGFLAVFVTAGIASAQEPPCPTQPPYPTQGSCVSSPGLPSGIGTDGQSLPGASSGAASQGAPGAAANQGAAGAAANQNATGAATDQGAPEGSSLPNGLGGSRSVFCAGSLLAPGIGLVSGAGEAPGFALPPPGSQVTTQIPVILPGLFTALQGENALPVDRVFVDYGYFNSFRVATQTVNPQALSGGSPVVTTTQGTANLNRFNIGAEKTFLDGRASIYVRVPFLDATNNTANLPIDGLGDISAGLKCVLLADKKTGSVLTAGMTVSAPTARDQVAVTDTRQVEGPPITTIGHFPFSPDVARISGLQSAIQLSLQPIPVFGRQTLVQPTTITVNPTFLQPWFAGLWVLDRLYVQDYVGFVLPTDTRVPPILNNDFGVGYQIYRSSPGQFLRFVRPTIDVQLVQPFTHRSGSGSVPITGNSASSNNSSLNIQEPALTQPTPDRQFNGVFGFPTQVFMAEGVQFGLGKRSLLSTAIVTPLVGPQAFTIGATVGFNFFF